MKPAPEHLRAYRNFLSNLIEFTDEEWDGFAACLSLKKLKKKERFTEAGLVCSEVGFTLKGAVRYFHVKDGEEITSYFSFENDMVSSYKSFVTQTPARGYIEALDHCEFLVFTYDGLQSLLQNPEMQYKMERFGRLMAETLLCCLEDRVFSFVNQSPEERYLELLNGGSSIVNRIPQHYLANYLGITAVSLSRIRNRIFKGNLKKPELS